VKILEVIAETLRTRIAHPTVVLNALIQLENNGGISAVYELEYRLERLENAMRQRADESLGVCTAWLESARAYIQTFTPEPVTVKPTVWAALQRLAGKR
jgi:hypothetical protein